MRSLAPLLLVASLTLPDAVGAQREVAPDDTVRVSMTDNRRSLVGVVTSVTPAGLAVVSRADERTLTVPWDVVERLELSAGYESNFAKKLLITTAISMAAFGFVMGLGWEEQHCSQLDWFCYDSRAEALGAGLATGAMVGVAVGVLVGRTPSRSWEPLSIPDFSRVGLVRLPSGGVSLGVRLAFGGL